MNVRRKTAFRSAIKEFKKAITDQDFNKAKELLPQVYKKLDKAAKNNTIKKNTASRRKSRLTQAMNKVATKTQ